MAFPTEQLSKDEQIVVDLRPHWWYIFPHSAGLAGAVLVGVIVLAKGWDWAKIPAGILVLVALGWFALRYSKWATTNFVITNERVISRRGVVAKKGIEIPLDRINTVFFAQTVFERILRAGDLGIESAGEQGRETFSDIRRPGLVQQEIYRQKEAFEANRMRQMGAAFAANNQTAAPQASIPEQIEKLDQLRKAGAITEAEFQAKKDDLLRRL